MRRIVGVLLGIFGLTIIGAGIFMQIDSKDSKKEENKEIFQYKEVPIKRINKFEKEETCSTYKSVNSFLNTTDYTKISFTYPNCVHEYDLSFWHKMLKNEDGTITINVKKEDETLNNYLNSVKTKLAADKYEDFYQDLEYTEVYSDETDSGLKVRVIEANYQTGLYTATTYDKWYIAVDLENDMLLIFEVESKDRVINEEAIKELYKNVIVEKEQATFLNTKKEGNYQVGSIRQNKAGYYDKGYKVNLKVPNKYPEVETTSSNYAESIFEIESVYERVYAWISLEKDNYEKTFQEKMANEKKYSLMTYIENPTTYHNQKDYGIVKKTIDGKEVYYYIFSYDYFLEDSKEKSYTGYFSEIYYEIEPYFYYKIYLTTKNIEINEALISDFLDFTVEEY